MSTVLIRENGSWVPYVAPGAGGTGIVEEVVAGTGIGVDATDPAAPIVSLLDTGAASLLMASVTLTDAELKALHTTYKVWVAAPGAGKIIVPFAMILRTIMSAGRQYTNLDGTYPAIIGATPFASTVGFNGMTLAAGVGTGLLGTSGVNPIKIVTGIGPVPTAATYGWNGRIQSEIENQPCYLAMYNHTSGNLTGGNAANSFKATLYYVIMDL
jgi:hypothetical protein